MAVSSRDGLCTRISHCARLLGSSLGGISLGAQLTLWRSSMALSTCVFSTLGTHHIASCTFHYAWKHRRCTSSIKMHIGIITRPIPMSCHGLPLWYKARRRNQKLKMMIPRTQKKLPLSSSQQCSLSAKL